MNRFLVECRSEDWGRVPTRFGRSGEMREISEVVDRWPGEGHCYFRVLADDGTIYILRHDEGEDSWRIHFFDDHDANMALSPAPKGRH